MDDADRATEYEMQRLDRCIQAARGIPAAAMEGASECAVCGSPIPHARRVAVPGCMSCVDCADAAERRARLGL
jgi:phage/conjugal plasmid C-4 type zinc finger TraR family protein